MRIIDRNSAKRENRKATKKGAGRPKGPEMPCGWCGKPMTATTMREHYTSCKKRPK